MAPERPEKENKLRRNRPSCRVTADLLDAPPSAFICVGSGNMSAFARCCDRVSMTLWLLLLLQLQRTPGLTLLLARAEQVALVEVHLEQRPGVSALLHGDVVESSPASSGSAPRDKKPEQLEGQLVLVSLSLPPGTSTSP